MNGPGALNRRLVLEAPVEVADDAGGVTRSFAVAATLWARLSPMIAAAEIAADARGGVVTHRIVIRRGPELTTRHRLRSGARIFEILAYRDPDEAGRFVEIFARERVG